jgi:hypothetical protein
VKSVIERLTAVIDHNGSTVYAEPEIRAVSTHALELAGHGLLAVCEDSEIEGSSWIEFAVFGFASGPATKDGVEVGPAYYERVFYGGGPSGVLRELRHTYWGNGDGGGYIFYPRGALITDALAKLQRWFDLD